MQWKASYAQEWYTRTLFAFLVLVGPMRYSKPMYAKSLFVAEAQSDMVSKDMPVLHEPIYFDRELLQFTNDPRPFKVIREVVEW